MISFVFVFQSYAENKDHHKQRSDDQSELEGYCQSKSELPDNDVPTCVDKILDCPESCSQAGISDCTDKSEAISKASTASKEAREQLQSAQEKSAESAKNFADAVQQWSEKKTENSQELKDSIQQATENANNAARENEEAKEQIEQQNNELISNTNNNLLDLQRRRNENIQGLSTARTQVAQAMLQAKRACREQQQARIQQDISTMQSADDCTVPAYGASKQRTGRYLPPHQKASWLRRCIEARASIFLKKCHAEDLAEIAEVQEQNLALAESRFQQVEQELSQAQQNMQDSFQRQQTSMQRQLANAELNKARQEAAAQQEQQNAQAHFQNAEQSNNTSLAVQLASSAFSGNSGKANQFRKDTEKDAKNARACKSDLSSRKKYSKHIINVAERWRDNVDQNSRSDSANQNRKPTAQDGEG